MKISIVSVFINIFANEKLKRCEIGNCIEMNTSIYFKGANFSGVAKRLKKYAGSKLIAIGRVI